MSSFWKKNEIMLSLWNNKCDFKNNLDPLSIGGIYCRAIIQNSSPFYCPNYSRLMRFTLEVFLPGSCQQLCSSISKICIKYGKHWKSYVSFQLSGQIGLIWEVRIYSPNWHQFPHERSMTIFKSIFKIYRNQKKLSSLVFKPKKDCWF